MEAVRAVTKRTRLSEVKVVETNVANGEEVPRRCDNAANTWAVEKFLFNVVRVSKDNRVCNKHNVWLKNCKICERPLHARNQIVCYSEVVPFDGTHLFGDGADFVLPADKVDELGWNRWV